MLKTNPNNRAHSGKKNDSSVRALAVKPRAHGAPLRGYGSARPSKSPIRAANVYL